MVINHRNINGKNFKKQDAYKPIIKTAAIPLELRIPLLHSNIPEGIHLVSFGKSKVVEFPGTVKATKRQPAIIMHPDAKKPFTNNKIKTGRVSKRYSDVRIKYGFHNCCLINVKSFLVL